MYPQRWIVRLTVPSSLRGKQKNRPIATHLRGFTTAGKSLTQKR